MKTRTLAAVSVAVAISILTSSMGFVHQAFAAAPADPIPGTYTVTYGAPAEVTILPTSIPTSGYAVTAKTPVRVTGASCDLSIGTLLASFHLVSGNHYTGVHGLWFISNCLPGPSTTLDLTLNGNQLNGVLGGGFGTVVFTRIGPASGLSAATKAALTQLSDSIGGPITALGTALAVGLPCLLIAGPTLGFGAIACFLLGIVAGLATSIGASYAGNAAKDPPDPNFRTVERPKIRHIDFDLPSGVRSAHLTNSERKAVNAFVHDIEQEAALYRAAITTNNRANSAIDAGDQANAARQLRAFYDYIGDLANVIDAEAADRTKLVEVFSKDLSGFALTVADVQKAQALATTSPTPQSLTEALSAQGVPPDFITSKLTAFASADPTQIAGGSVLNRLADPGILSSMHTLAKDLRLDVQLHGFSDLAKARAGDR